MSVLYFTVAGNTAPNILLTLERDSTVIDLTGATVNLYITREDTGAISNTGHTSCTVTGATAGTIRYTPQAGDFPSAGRYLAEAKITYSGGTIERLYEVVTIVARDAF